MYRQTIPATSVTLQAAPPPPQSSDRALGVLGFRSSSSSIEFSLELAIHDEQPPNPSHILAANTQYGSRQAG